MARGDDDGPRGAKWVPYRDRPEWKDVIPVPQDDGSSPIVRIAYSDQFKDIFDYFRAVLKSDERSERAFKLVSDAVNINPSNYTVWHYRRALLQDLERDLHDELGYIQQVIEDNPKNYQVWHHRRVIVEWLQDPSYEKEFTESILQMDAKNYHAWQHRQWAISEFGLWDGELDYVTELLEDDIRNNSAWNQRYFVISRTTGYTEDVRNREIKYTIESIRKAPHNESPWSYLRGILEAAGGSASSEVCQFCEDLYAQGCRVSYLLAFIVDTLADKLAVCYDGDIMERVQSLCKILALEEDVIRKEYWTFVGKEILHRYKQEHCGIFEESSKA
ncbi:protein farnesyltransferase/geranylgeranyltransferase type-1 subunit alpha-like [Ornithodoros turicata]